MPREIPIKRESIGRFLLVAWALLAVVGLASFSVEHLASLPEPANETFLSHALLDLRRNAHATFLVHVIYSDCSCSRSLFTHLLKRGPFPGAEELILFVGKNEDKRQAAGRAGFEFDSVSDSELLSRFALEAAPVLVVFDANGKLLYAGGYYDHPATITPLDEKIHAQLVAGSDVQPLPVFGCAVSPRLQKSLDPWRFLPFK